MTFYPSIEDIKIDKYLKAKNYESEYDTLPSLPYPTLLKYVNDNEVLMNDLATETASQISNHTQTTNSSSKGYENNRLKIVAPLSERAFGFERSAITGGLKEIDIYKDELKSSLGIKIKTMDQGIFVVALKNESPAYYAGVKFSDQIIEINGFNVTGSGVSKIEKFMKKLPSPLTMILRDRPFVRTLTIHKGSGDGQLGFSFKNGITHKIVPGTSAARNGLLVHQYILEVNGESLVGLKDPLIKEALQSAGDTLNLTIMPSLLYDKFFKR